MLFQTDLFLARAFLSLSIQLGGGIVAIYMGIKLLKRNKNKMTIPVSAFYILLGSTYLLLAAFIFILIDPITYIAYLVSYNMGNFGYMLNVIIVYNLLHPRDKAFFNVVPILLVYYGIKEI